MLNVTQWLPLLTAPFLRLYSSLLVPPALRQYAALDQRVVLVGQGNKFELWDDAKWLERTEHAVAFPAGGLPPELDGFSL